MHPLWMAKEKVRAQGYATDCEEFDGGLMDIPYPVCDHDHRVHVAVSACES